MVGSSVAGLKDGHDMLVLVEMRQIRFKSLPDNPEAKTGEVHKARREEVNEHLRQGLSQN
jgi:hypothetical protein